MVNVSSRNQVIDVLRGYFLVVIGIDHAYLNPNIWNSISGQNMLWVSAAEGFFFVSGLMVGMVRNRQIDTLGWQQVIGKLYKRAAILYAWTVGLTMVFTGIGWWANNPVGMKAGIYTGDIWHMLIDAISLRYVYGWMDFLPYYIGFLLVSPLVLWLVRQQLSAIAISLSITLWLTLGRHSFFMAWQLLFMVGIVVGCHWPSILQWLHRIPVKQVNRIKTGLWTVAAITLAISVIYVYWPAVTSHLPWFNQRHVIDELTNKVTLGPVRVGLFALWFCALYSLVHHYRRHASRAIVRACMSLGRNSLSTYIAQAIVLFSLKMMVPGPYDYWGNSAWIGLELAIVWLIVNWAVVMQLAATPQPQLWYLKLRQISQM